MKRLVRELYIRDNCHPFKEYIMPWVQIPLWISISLALRNMAGALPVEGSGEKAELNNFRVPVRQTFICFIKVDFNNHVDVSLVFMVLAN